jgi:carbonic anhydrase
VNHSSKQSMAWIFAVGLSGSIYGGGALWLKQSKFAPSPAGHEDGEHKSEHALEHEPEHQAAHEPEHKATHETTHKPTHKTTADAGHEDHSPATDHGAVKDSEHLPEHKSPKAQSTTANGSDHSHKSHWTYGKTDAAGPSHWGDLAQNFSQCEKGMEQSPVDIRDAQFSAITPTIKWHYGAAKFAVENNGHTIQSTLSSDENYVTIDGEPYTLAQFHFHNPSEHRFKGVPSDMELHFVHKNKDGKLAVISVMINEAAGKENKAFKPVWDILPRDANTKAHGNVDLKLTALLPSKTQYIHYKGSLTTPPCSEGVRWFVMKDPITISSGQLEMYTSIFDGSTNRPVQPLQGREILTNVAPAMAH